MERIAKLIGEEGEKGRLAAVKFARGGPLRQERQAYWRQNDGDIRMATRIPGEKVVTASPYAGDSKWEKNCTVAQAFEQGRAGEEQD